MECQPCDSKKLFKVFDASKRKRGRKKDGLDDTNSVATDDSVSLCQPSACRPSSRKTSHQDITAAETCEGQQDHNLSKREREVSPAMSRSPEEVHRHTHSPRRHRRGRDGLSLALKAGLVSTPRSTSPTLEGDCADTIPQDQDSFIYAFLEEAIKRDKKKHRHSHSHSRRRTSRGRDASLSRDHRHRHHRRRDNGTSRDRDKPTKDTSVSPIIDQAVLFETFAKLCSQLNDKAPMYAKSHQVQETVHRTQSHKSLQCEVVTRHDPYEAASPPARLRSHDRSREMVASRIRSHEHFPGTRSREKIQELERSKEDKCMCCYEKEIPKFDSKVEVTKSRMDERYREYPPINVQTRSCIDPYRNRPPDPREYRDYDKNARQRYYEDDKRKCFEQKTSRSFDMRREAYPEDDRACRRTVRSETNKERRYDERDKRYDERDKRYEEKYYDDKLMESRDRVIKDPNRGDRRWKRNLERLEKTSVASRDDDYRERERDRYSERERDSGLSVADGETSTMSGRSNCLKVVKQEIAEQREAMDKMMKLWKELMRCFKGIPQTQEQDKAVHDSAANVRDSAAAQLRLWRECMRRYETVARDVGDTDARLMEEIKKQRCEMAEMAGMWQECLQRYRDMSSDFNSLKQKLATSESPTRMPAPPLACAEGEGSVPPAPYRLPPNYPPLGAMPAGYAAGGSPLRPRASAPPAWWWCDAQRPPPDPRSPRSPRRRSSPDSRASRDRDRRHRHKEETRYKEKSKPSAARSEHRHRKR